MVSGYANTPLCHIIYIACLVYLLCNHSDTWKNSLKQGFRIYKAYFPIVWIVWTVIKVLLPIPF